MLTYDELKKVINLQPRTQEEKVMPHVNVQKDPRKLDDLTTNLHAAQKLADEINALLNISDTSPQPSNEAFDNQIPGRLDCCRSLSVALCADLEKIRDHLATY